MTTFEIVKMYKEAADKNAQIKILADMNLCSPEDILLVLQNEGVISGVKCGKKERKTEMKPRKEKFSWTEEAKEQVRAFLSEGLTVLETAERMGLDLVQVRNAVTRFKLRENAKCKGQNAECKMAGKDENVDIPALCSGLFSGTKGTKAIERSEERISDPAQSLETQGQHLNALAAVSLIRDYAKCITALPAADIRNYERIVRTFAESIIEGADSIIKEGERYGA